MVNLAQDPIGRTRLSLHILNCGTAQAIIQDIREVLPAGYVYDGNLQSTNLLNSSGGAFSLGAPTLEGAPWSFTGPNPWNNCNSLTTNQASNQQRVAWSWPDASTAPRVNQGVTALISFDIKLNETQLAGSYPDAPWVHTTQNQCAPGNVMQAGAPTSVTITYTAIITSSQGNSSVKSLVEISPGGHKIKAQLNGN